MADAGTGGAGVIRVDVSESGQNAAANSSVVNYAFYLIEATVSNTTWKGGGITAYVDWGGVVNLWSGSFGFDWRGAGNQVTLIASGSFTVGHDAAGNAYVVIEGGIGATGTQGAGGPTSVAQGIQLTTLTQLPGTPYNVTAVRVSDTQVTLSWNAGNPSNGQPTATAIDVRVNNGAWTRQVNIGGTTSASLAASPNQKLEYRVYSGNAAGYNTVSAPSAPIYTAPAAPTNATAVKGANLNIDIAFTTNVGYNEHTHEVWHGTVAGGVTTWDAAALVTLASNVTAYTHVTPNAAQVHVYRVRAMAGALASGYATTQSVQLLIAPNKPTVPAMDPSANRAVALDLTWVHNSIDTTPQTAYEYSYSVDGGTTWVTTGKVISTAAIRTVVANTYAANTALTTRVRTWGSATTGGAESTGASPWSNLRTVTFKTVPTASITSPATGSTINDATVRVAVGFTQPEGATFVKAQLELLLGAVLVETLDSSIQVGITLDTQVANGTSYTLRARVQDSNGLWSAWVASAFNVVYLAPVPAVIKTSYLPDNGYGQLDLTIAAPGTGQAAATKVTITRNINDVEETIVKDYPVLAALTFLDTTPTIHGTNAYTITTTSALGAQTSVIASLVTTECRRAYLSKSPAFNTVVVFGANLSVAESLSVASDTIQAAGRTKPIGLYGMETSVQLKVGSFLFEGFGSTIDQVRDILLLPGKACYRDGSGRRVFGSVNGSVSYKKATRGDLSFTLTETS